MTEHTQLPWQQDGSYVFCTTAEGMHKDIADCARPLTASIPEGKANAAFIVKACNAHEELVAALNACLEAVTHQDIGTYDMDGQSFYDALEHASKAAQAALAKVSP